MVFDFYIEEALVKLVSGEKGQPFHKTQGAADHISTGSMQGDITEMSRSRSELKSRSWHENNNTGNGENKYNRNKTNEIEKASRHETKLFSKDFLKNDIIMNLRKIHYRYKLFIY